MTNFKRFLTLFLISTLAISVWGTNVTLSLSDFGWTTNSYTSTSITKTVGFTCNNGAKNGTSNMAFKKGASLWNTSAFSQDITSVVINVAGYSSSSNAGFYVYGGTSSGATTTTIVNNNGTTGEIIADFSDYSYKFFTITVKSDRAMYVSSIVINYGSGGCTTITPTLTYSSTSLTVGDVTAVPTVDKDGSTGGVTYESSNPSVATVAADGKVTAVAAGNATITATIAAAGGKCAGTATADFTVTSGGGGGGGGTGVCSYDLSTNSYASASTSTVSWTSNSTATMTLEKSSSGTNANNYIPTSYSSTRFYTSQELTITPKTGKTITSIIFTATTTSYASALHGSSWTNATSAVSGSTVTVTPTNGTSAVSATIGGTCGFSCVEFVEGASYDITAVSNDNTMGTVSITGNTITAAPAAGYRVSETTPYNVTSGTATVTRGTGVNINKFYVSATSDCTVRINFEALPTYTIRFFDGALKLKEETVALGGIATPPSAPAGCPIDGYTFVGWWTTPLSTTNTTSYTWITDFTVSAAQDYYAVYRNTAGGSEVTLDATTDTSFPKDGITLSVSNGTLTNETDYRVYKGATLTVSSSVGNMSNIAFTYESSSYDGGGWASSYQPNATSWTSPSTSGEQAHITRIVVTLGTVYFTTTSVCRDCEVPTLTFAETAVNAFDGDVFTKVPVLGGSHSLSSTITYSSNSLKATVDPSTGEVTINNATGGSETITITATIAAVDNGGTSCQREASASYTINAYNRVTWMIAGDEYTTAGPTRQTTEGGEIENFPPDPDGAAVCGSGKVFRGWTTSEYEGATKPGTLYTSSSTVHITENTTFYAVFAESGGESETDFHKISSLSEITDGKHVLIVYHNAAYALDSAESDYGNAARSLSISAGKVTINRPSLVWTVSIGSSGGFIFTQGENYLNSWSAKNGTHYLWVDEYTDEWIPSPTSGSGPFILSSSVDAGYNMKYETYSGDKYFIVGTGTSTNYQMDFYIPDIGFTNYTTACCNEVDIPTASVLARSTSATISWENQLGATNGYCLIVKQGETTKYENTTIAAGTTSINVTGLSESTPHTFILTAKGATCNRSYYGNFSTTDCEDVPYNIDFTPALKSVTIRWTATAPTATVKIYSDEGCTAEVASRTVVSSPLNITGLEENTTYYVKIWANGTCESEPSSFVTNTTTVEIAEWFPDGIHINIDADANASVQIEDKQEKQTGTTSYATGLFFSKYYEAYQNIKLWAIYNGTQEKISLANVKVQVSSNGAAWGKDRNGTATAAYTTSFASFGHKETGWIYPGEEIIIYNSGNSDADKATISCMESAYGTAYKTNPDSLWYEVRNNTTAISGDDGLILLNGTDTIDVIGGKRYAAAYAATTTTSWGDNSGWVCATGEDETGTKIGISTNRCLLVRKNSVKDGLNAVANNLTNFTTLCDEWWGKHVPTSSDEVQTSCDNFSFVGHYDYNSYYATYDTLTRIDDLDGHRNEDGTYTIPIPQLDTLSCTMLRVKVFEGDEEKVSREYKVPIMIKTDDATTADDAYFHSYAREENSTAVCKECDVVILGNGTLTKASSDNAKDIPEIRNMTIYPGGKLIVPEGAKYEYTVNSIQFRVQGEQTPVAQLKGDLITNNQQVIVSRRIKNDRYYFFSLPYDCNIADIRWSNGEIPVRGTDYEIVEYDAATRAAEGSTKGAPGHWKPVTGTQLKAGVGYNVAVGSDILRELIFPMAIGQTNLTTKENDKTTNKVTLTKYTGPSSMNNHNWNLIAHPYVSQFSAYDDAKIKVGYLHCVTPATPEAPNSGVWELLDGENVYLTMPSFSASKITYTHTISSAPSLKLDPFLAVFVQAAEAGELTFSQSNRILSAPARHLAAETEYEDESIFVGVTLSGNGQSDQTNVRIRPDFTDEYQLGYDLQKFTTYYTERPQVYMKTPSHQLAFQAVSDSVAKSTFLPMGVYCYQAGTFTFALSEDYPIDEIEAVYLYDATTGTTTNLLYDTYTITTTKQLYTNTRFALNVIVNRKAPQITTGIDDLKAPDNVVRKILINGHVYIQRGGEIYDITGKEVFNF